MALFWIAIAIFSKIIYVENRIVPLKYITIQPMINEIVASPNDSIEDNMFEKIREIKNVGHKRNAEVEPASKHIGNDKTKKPCSIVVLSNAQNPTMQSLLRKYRYDARGVLIPSSVKYFIKLPQGFGTAPILMPLNDKAFSPLGGFVRYYKEVPPIPQSW